MCRSPTKISGFSLSVKDKIVILALYKLGNEGFLDSR